MANFENTSQNDSVFDPALSLGADDQKINKKSSGRVPSRSHKRGSESKRTSIVSIDSSSKRSILIIGMIGEGKSTLGNKILNSSHFKISSTDLPQTCIGHSIATSATQSQNYWLKVYDHDGLFNTEMSVALSSLFGEDDELSVDLVLFVIQQGHYLKAAQQETLDCIMREWDISNISAMIITHCEKLSQKGREVVIHQFKDAHPAVTKFMKFGIYTVGFPDHDQHYVRDKTSLIKRIEKDEAMIRGLIYSSERRVKISRRTPPSETTKTQAAKGTLETKSMAAYRDTSTERPYGQLIHPPPPDSAAHSPPQTSALSPKQLEDDYQPSKPKQIEMTNGARAAIKPIYQVRGVIDSNKGNRRGLGEKLASKIFTLVKKFEKNSDPDQSLNMASGNPSSKFGTNSATRLEDNDIDGGKTCTPTVCNPMPEQSLPTFERTPSPNSITAELPSRGPGQPLESPKPIEQNAGYKSSSSLDRQSFPPADLVSLESKKDQSEKTNTLPRNFERFDALESSPRSKRKLPRRQSVKDLQVMFEKMSRGHAKGSSCARPQQKLASSNRSTWISGTENVAEFDEYEVRHHFLSLIEWKELSISDRVHKVSIYDTAESKWDKIADLLGLTPSRIKSIRQDHHDNHGQMTDVFTEWFENANQLPNHSKYPKKWSGLIRLLEDSNLGELAKDLKSALCAPYNDVKGNLSKPAGVPTTSKYTQ